MASALYELRGVAKFFQRGPTTVRALDGVDLEIAAGEFVALEGPSGSGKTTLLQLLGALDRPSAGDVVFEGRDLASLPDHELAATPAALVRVRLPAVQPHPDAVGRRERRGEAGAGRRDASSGRSSCSTRSASASAPTTSRSSCRAASSSAWRSPAPCRSSRASCSRTSRPATSTPRRAARSSSCSPVSRPSTARR